jgi:hypothetical protein
VSLVEVDGSPCVAVKAQQSTQLGTPYDRSTSSDHIQQQACLDRIDSLSFFRGKRPAEQSDNVVANQTRHIIRDLDLVEPQGEHNTDGSNSTQVSYAAVPIKSVSGQLIGIYSVMDSRIRDDFLDQGTYSVLNDIASATSRYLESQHVQLEKDHNTRAKLNLSRFLEHNRPQPARTLHTTRHLPSVSGNCTHPSRDNPSPVTSSSSSSTFDDTSTDETVFSAANTPSVTPAEECSGFDCVSPPLMPILDKGSVTESSRITTVSENRPPHRALSVAASQIRAAHDLEGLVILDATFSNDQSPLHPVHDTTVEQPSKCEKLEVSIITEDHMPARITSSMSFEHDSLRQLISHFPQGCVLKVGEEGVSALVVTDTLRSGPALYERLDETIVIPSDLKLLLHRAQSLIFMPLWDSARQAFYAGMLGWATTPTRVFTEHDLLSLSIYGRILTAEITRLGTYLDSIVRKTITDYWDCRCNRHRSNKV